jgi:hypothetical protein
MQHYVFTPMDLNTTMFPSRNEAHHFYTTMFSRPDELENGLPDPPTDLLEAIQQHVGKAPLEEYTKF